jgi:hypothetical protein
MEEILLHIRIFFVLLFFVHDVEWMDVSGWSSTPARGPQDGPNVHHGFIFDVTITYFCIRPGFIDKSISVLHA